MLVCSQINQCDSINVRYFWFGINFSYDHYAVHVSVYRQVSDYFVNKNIHRNAKETQRLGKQI